MKNFIVCISLLVLFTDCNEKAKKEPEKDEWDIQREEKRNIIKTLSLKYNAFDVDTLTRQKYSISKQEFLKNHSKYILHNFSLNDVLQHDSDNNYIVSIGDYEGNYFDLRCSTEYFNIVEDDTLIAKGRHTKNLYLIVSLETLQTIRFKLEP